MHCLRCSSNNRSLHLLRDIVFKLSDSAEENSITVLVDVTIRVRQYSIVLTVKDGKLLVLQPDSFLS